MKRINVTFYDEFFAKLETRTNEKQCSSVAQSIRELTELGLKIEGASKENADKKQEEQGLNTMIEVMKSNLRWTLESLLSIRYLLEQLNENNHEQTKEIIQRCKEQALNHVQKMFNQLGETVN